MKFAAIGLNHGHIFGQVAGLLKIPNAQCVAFHAVEPDLCKQFSNSFPNVPWREQADILADPSIQLITSASIFSDRGPLAAQCLLAGKHVLMDKPPVTTLQHVDALAHALHKSGKLLFGFYGERLSNPFDIKAKQLVDSGALGKIVHCMGLGPHKLNPASRPQWFFDPLQYGGILNDIASHQIEWFVWLTNQRITSFHSRVAHFGSVPIPSFQDFGDVTLTGSAGTTAYIRVDWFTPQALPSFGDIRGLIVGTKGTIELRRTLNTNALDPSNPADTAPHMILTTTEKPPHRVDAADTPITWPQDVARSIAENTNLLLPHETLLHVMETTVKIQQSAQTITPTNP